MLPNSTLDTMGKQSRNAKMTPQTEGTCTGSNIPPNHCKQKLPVGHSLSDDTLTNSSPHDPDKGLLWHCSHLGSFPGLPSTRRLPPLLSSSAPRTLPVDSSHAASPACPICATLLRACHPQLSLHQTASAHVTRCPSRFPSNPKTPR